MIPIKYNIRNLRVRWVNTLMTVLGTGLVVWSSCILFGLVDGLQHSLTVSGDPLDLIVLRKGSSNETNGGFALDTAEKIANVPGVARGDDGKPLSAPELLNIPIARRRDGTTTNIIVRGVTPVSSKLRPKFTIVEGRDLDAGKGECIASRSMSRRFKDCRVGDKLAFGEKESYRVVGIFTAGGSAAESEIWVDRDELARKMSREGTISSVQVRAASATDLERLKKTLENDAEFKLAALGEVEYYAQQTRASLFLKAVGTIIAILLTFGAMFAAANTMYAAVKSRTREIGTMRALGFRRFDILASFLTESLVLCALGGALGILATLPLRMFTFGTMSNFSEVAVGFRIGPNVLAVAAAMTAAMGLFGGLFPALRAVRLDVITALREV